MGMTLGERMLMEAVHRAQAERNWNDSEMAEFLGLSRQAFSDINRGRRSIGKIVRARILAKLDLTDEDVYRPELRERSENLIIEPQLYQILISLQDKVLNIQERLSVLEASIQACPQAKRGLRRMNIN